MAKKSVPANGKSLVIVESPAKARTISKYLGPNYIVEASIGHVRDLPEGTKEVPADGQLSVVVPDDQLEGQAAIVVVVSSSDGALLAQMHTTVGGG